MKHRLEAAWLAGSAAPKRVFLSADGEAEKTAAEAKIKELQTDMELAEQKVADERQHDTTRG